MSFLAGQSELVFRADEMQVFSGQWDLTGAGFSFFWADGGAQRRRRVFIRTPCGVQGELTNGWLSRPRAITFRRKYCVAAARSCVGAGQSCAGMVPDGMGRCGMRRTDQGIILKTKIWTTTVTEDSNGEYQCLSYFEEHVIYNVSVSVTILGEK